LKKTLGAVIAAATIATLAVPAGAAVPKKKATTTLACPGESGKVARIWTSHHRGNLTKFAVDNPCSQYLVFHGAQTYASGDSRSAMAVVPGAHFNWGKKRIAMYSTAIVTIQPAFKDMSDWECMGPTTVMVVERYNVVRPAQDENGDGC